MALSGVAYRDPTVTPAAGRATASVRFWGVDRQVDRFAVQALRADPPALAGQDDDRRRVFGAALEQFDQLLGAVEAVGPATAPIPLFSCGLLPRGADFP